MEVHIGRRETCGIALRRSRSQPSVSSRRNASRTGVRLHPMRAEISPSLSSSPPGMSPLRMLSLTERYASSLAEMATVRIIDTRCI
ncbi:Uncharacterised protein [Mycobacteroides abscessus subsp. abscessus]|nr:Uncharacterised protein [Mycobacteroides abscessus subsp. abscessus]